MVDLILALILIISAIKKITKDEIYLKLKKIAFSKGFTLNIDEAQLTMVY